MCKQVHIFVFQMLFLATFFPTWEGGAGVYDFVGVSVPSCQIPFNYFNENTKKTSVLIYCEGGYNDCIYLFKMKCVLG